MKLNRIHARNYKCIDDTGWVEIDDLTCLVGKNEAGKTVLMEAIERLNPAYEGDGLVPEDDYPRHAWPEYANRHPSDPDPVITAEFELTPEERELLAERGGRPIDDTVTVTRDYAGGLDWTFDVDEDAAREWIRETEAVAGAETEAGSLADALGQAVLEPRLPAFRYVGEYTTLDARIDVDAFLDRREHGELTASDRTFEALFAVAGLDPETLRDGDDWRRILTELETASTEITRSVSRYWSQADDVAVTLRGTETGDGRAVELRVENPRHGVTVEFDSRSRGFRWFFSTFCTVAALREGDDDVVLLLDEPGLHLHAKAKREFLRFLETEFVDANTLIYSTHSPFMIDVDRAHRTKLVRKDPEAGTTVVSDPGDVDPYTRYPLRNVFELDVLETMISRSRLLFVEDGTTYEYLYNVSELLADTDAATLDRRWTVLPVGTLENVGTVRSVFDATDGDAAVVHDGTTLDGWEPPAGVKVVGLGAYASVDGDATVEDVLSEAFYLGLVSQAYAGEFSAAPDVPERLTADDLPADAAGAPIVERLDRLFERHDVGDGSFDRSRVASYLQANRAEFASEIDMDTRKTFGALNRALNATLEDIDGGRRGRGSFLDSLFGR